MLMNLIIWIILGGVAGWLAGVLMGGTGLGTIGTIVLGIIGALVGGFVVQLLGFGNPLADGAEISIAAIVTAVVGAIVVILIARLVMGSRTRA
ncbi:MAG TPA: GlsB/YeaQ/YmgE family stress response membrane protein [Candidatus Limnocylindrales bacterium]|jgi:uncharacterized membrane protein YeaQ/YmgE (transglycosylase-associated protein family)|nr:GlsB/YeaQ/YmgE family stress response membrane protein [Candidatus Limnocylindrales bacterium]